MERFASLGLISSKEKIREVFHEVVLDHETDVHVEIDEDDLARMLDYDGEARAKFIVLQSPYKESLASLEFTEQLSELAINNAKGVIVELISGRGLKMSDIREIMATISVNTAPGSEVVLGTKYEVIQDDVIFLFVITSGIA